MSIEAIVAALAANPKVRHAAESLVKRAIRHAVPDLYQSLDHEPIADAVLREVGKQLRAHVE